MALFLCNVDAFYFPKPSPPIPPLALPRPHTYISPCQTLFPHYLRGAFATRFPCIEDAHIFHLS